MLSDLELSKLDPHTFEHLVNRLVIRILGCGHTTFGPGPDGGRDGYFEGEAPYPSVTDRWKGRWFIQSKFHRPHLSKDPQKWLLHQIKTELATFGNAQDKRTWPDNWIIATNIDPSAAARYGTFDKARALVRKVRPKLAARFHIWGGKKIVGFLDDHKDIASFYGHFLTPGHVLTDIQRLLEANHASIDRVLYALVVRQFEEQQYTKLEQAGSSSDTRPGIHNLFIDLPFSSKAHQLKGLALNHLCIAAAQCHCAQSEAVDSTAWGMWQHHPRRARTWFLRGGPGRGKSTIGQYYAQIQRAALILSNERWRVKPGLRDVAQDVKARAEAESFWPLHPRVPIVVELRDYAYWLGNRPGGSPKGVATYLADRLSAVTEQNVPVGTILEMLRTRAWFSAFDGLDEVSDDVKGIVAKEVLNFIDHIALESNCDLFSLCTSRPQGYSGQYDAIDGPTLDLIDLSPDRALACAKPVFRIDRSEAEAKKSYEVLTTAIQSDAIQQLMTTPLQAHIMAVVVREGGRPPERRWQLFNNFYNVIRRREANRNLPDVPLARLLREEERLLKTLHNRLGFVLHAFAETKRGAEASLARDEFRGLVDGTVRQLRDTDVDATVAVLMRAAEQRLVLVTTPEQGDRVRFDIRQLQEFFAAEFLYEAVDADTLRQRLELLGGDPHWHEVIHFALSALVESNRQTDLLVAVQTLVNLNRESRMGMPSFLNRRLSRGGIFAARLLEEGVLEQDKRMRQIFAGPLEPMSALTEVGPTAMMARVMLPNSRAWLVEFLLEALRVKQHHENVGAAIALAFLLRDGDAAIKEFVAHLIAAPTSYRSFVLYQRLRQFPLRPFRRESEERPTRWLLRLLVETLSRADWCELEERAVAQAIRVLSHSVQKSSATLKELGLSRSAHSALLWLRDAYIERPRGTSNITVGPIELYCFRVNWTTPSDARELVAEVDIKSLAETGGLFTLAGIIAAFAREQSTETLRAVAKALLAGVAVLPVLRQSQLGALIPVPARAGREDVRAWLHALCEASNRELQEVIGRRILNGKEIAPPYLLGGFGRGDVVGSTWEDAFRVVPYFAYYSALERAGFFEWSAPQEALKPSELKPILGHIGQCREVIRESVYAWGALIASDPSQEESVRRELRAAARTLPRSWEDVGDDGYSVGPPLCPFALDLPREADLLPYVATATFAFALRARKGQDGGDGATTIDKFRGVVNAYIGDPQSLVTIGQDEDLSPDVRASATLMRELHPFNEFDWGRLLESLRTIGVTSLKEPTVLLLARLLRLEADPYKTDGPMTLLEQLFEVHGNDYFLRERLTRVLARWREISGAPVTTNNVVAPWLAA